MSDGDNPLEFSARDLMPDWAQETKKDESKTSAKRFGRDYDDKSGKRGRDRKGGGDRRGGDRRGGDRRGGYGGDRRGGYGGDRRGGGGRDFRGGERRSNDRRGNDHRGGGRRDERRGGRDGFRPDPLPAGISVSIEPSEAAVNGLVRHIRETFRSFPLSDLAKMIVRERERYDLHFKAEPEKARLYQCLADKSLWLSRDEAVAHLLNGPAVKEYYAVEEVEVGAPTGNFNAIAVCGMSGTLLGPSNHHEYQKNILKLHQERFSNMSLERFKSRIRMENDEEIIEKWKEQVSRASHYRVKTGGEAAASAEPAEEAVAEEAKAEEEVAVESEVSETSEEGEGVASAEDQDAPGGTGESGTAEEAVGDDATGDEQVVEEETEAAEEASSEEPSADSGEEELVLKSQEELAQHFREHFAGDAVVEVSEVLVPGNISGKDLSQGLLAYVKQEGEKLRRGFPLPMIQSLCREFEKHGMRFFKRGKKALHVSAIRPRVISSAVSLSEDVQKVVDFITTNPGRKVVDLLDALVEDFSKPDKSAPTEEIELSDAAKQVLSNLRWLTSEGYVLEFADTKLHIGKAPRAEGQAPAKKAKKKVGKSERREKKEAPVAEEIPEKPAGPEAEVAEGQSKAVAKDSETPEVKAPEVADSPASDPEEAASGSDEIPPEVGVVSEEEQPVDAVEEVCEEPSSANGETESGPASEEEEGATKSE